MTTEKVDFTDVKWTMLVTLYHRAMDSRTKPSILRDHAAAEAIDRIDYNFNQLVMRATSGDRYMVVLRAKQLDEWAVDFLARHPDATVLQLGCGLDSRAFRLDLPEGVRWYDVDLPEVIELRRRLYQEHDNYRMLASSVTEPAWLEQIPNDRPTLVIAEGLLMYLVESDVRRLLQRLTGHLPGGELMFDGIARWVLPMSKLMFGPLAGFRMGWAIGDGLELERWNPRLTYVTSVSSIARHAEIPVPGYRAMYGVVNKLSAYRNAIRLFRYEF
jgi:methyltransferase (TIGR00027 family)